MALEHEETALLCTGTACLEELTQTYQAWQTRVRPLQYHTQVPANRTITILLKPGVTERINSRRVSPYSRRDGGTLFHIE
eukprot:scaffold2173_cov66-Skeletonema_dohrnii-CCMP3373.AAC.3